MKVQCKCCNRTPDQISEYVSAAEECESTPEKVTPEEYVIQEEGTYNPQTGKFYCTECYIKLGCPSGKA